MDEMIPGRNHRFPAAAGPAAAGPAAAGPVRR